ncbi:hypothetical protein SPRG_20600 [Saprolegnia parasitica CBS 223.65]|uniref:Myosin motor domain-containing protein n=1 Tax=Saprolegnia parasitica (strain CBS 223.65) TaxID=695850 RepID=A0A067C714_SAPPC|nr:hypothetical protein SPRG_20600 [Saprolegnia parasitica CBS 223.65]KDO26278.1 hypothetical protein SPRG_20600 [Saprolegnia parasitica CBS 223.65]|eukprot:XP_012203061.1 hypothetical protein SPRG_20600 [Saprolegnia parasitica CBS 223.65]
MEAGARVWVKDDDEIWVPGIVYECHDLHRVRVRREGGRGDVDIDLRHGAEAEPSLQLRNDLDDFTSVPNLIQLQYLHEPELLFAVANRFEHDLIYTYIGDILLAFNPFRPINMYSTSHVRAYEAMDSDAPPHVFAIASMAYRCMRDEKKNQSILVSGESGAGKTENTKFLMQYLATVGASSTSSPAKTPAKRPSRLKTTTAPVTVTTTTDIQTQILQTNPILEAFGNAKTVRNDNSSRFGKFIALQFGADAKMVGAKISVYLLEKIRLSHQSLGERNFHIFYELCAGADDDLADALELGGMEDYAILSQSECYERRSVDDAAQFNLTTQAFRDMGVPDDETTTILSVLDAFLQKNQDALPAEAVALCQGSSASIVQALLGAPKRKQGGGSTTKGALSRAPSSLRAASVSAQFKSQLDDLIRVIGNTQARYIRCVKSNDAGAPRCLHKPRVVQQLRSGGVLEAVRIARAGYAVREDHSHFVQAFGFLVPKPKKPKSVPSGHRGDGMKQRTELVVAAVLLALDAPDAALARTILSNGKYSRTELQDACGRAGFQLGYSKIFFRKEVYNQLRWLRRQTLTACTLTLQRLYRGHVARVDAKARREAVQLLQTWARAALTVRRQRKASATMIQSAYRRHVALTRYRRLRRGVDACQRLWRSRRVWQAAREARDARRRAEEATVAGQLRKQQEELARARDAIEAAAAAERAALAAERQRQRDEEAATRAAWAAERAAAEAAHREAFERECQAMRDELQRQKDQAARHIDDDVDHPHRRVETPGGRLHVSTSSQHARRLQEDEHERRATAREAIVVEAARVASPRHGQSSVTCALDAGDMAHVLGALGIQAPSNATGENGDLVDNYAQCLQALSVVVEQPMVIKALTQILQAVSHPDATPSAAPPVPEPPRKPAVVEADLVAPPPPPEPHLPPALEPLHPVIDTVKEVYDYSMSYSVVRFLVTKIQDKATSRLSTILTNPTVQTALLTAHSLTATAWHAACEYYPLATQVSNDVERLRAAVLSRACVPLPATSMPLEEMLVNSAEVRQSLIELALEQEAKIKELEAAVAENASFFNQMASAMAHGPQGRPPLAIASDDDVF